jgi:hypothetical protein
VAYFNTPRFRAGTLAIFSRFPNARSTLPLFMTRIGADNKDYTATADDFAMFANSLNAGSDFHGSTPIFCETDPKLGFEVGDSRREPCFQTVAKAKFTWTLGLVEGPERGKVYQYKAQ